MSTAPRRRVVAIPLSSTSAVPLSDLALAALVLAAGLTTVATYGYALSTALSAPAAAAIAVALRRRAPAISLAVIAIAALLQRSSGAPLSVAQVSIFLVLYSAAAYGRPAVLWLSGSVVVALSALAAHYSSLSLSLHLLVSWSATSSTPGLGRRAIVWLAVLFGSAPSWLLGLLRRAAVARRNVLESLSLAQAQAATAAAVASAQQQRAALARDVHDVVGHSLAVIIALSESIRFRDLTDDEDATQVVATVGLIAQSARDSLAMVREVLAQQPESATSTGASAARDGGGTRDEDQNTSLLDLFQRVRSAGLILQISHLGEPRDLPEGHRRTLVAVIQELLTNALHHSDTSCPVSVNQDWTRDELIIIVTSVLPPPSAPRPSTASRTGMGLPGIRDRLESIHGTLHVRIDTQFGSGRYISEVHLPLTAQVFRSTLDESDK